MNEEQLNEHGMLLHSTETCLFDGSLGLEHNSKRIQKMAQRYGWRGTCTLEDDDDLLENTDEAMDYLNQHAMADGYYVAFVDGDVMVMAELDDDDDPFTNGDIQLFSVGSFLDAQIGPEPEPVDMRCNRCEALMINGVYCHEHGCPNSGKEKVDGEWVATQSGHGKDEA